MRLFTNLLLIAFLLTGNAFSQSPDTERPVLKAQPLDFETGEDEPAILPEPYEEDLAESPGSNMPVQPPTVAPDPVEKTVIKSLGQTQDADPVTVPSIAQIPEGDDAVRLQIFLDESNFGPGVIDGKIGQFSKLAVQSWNELHGHPLDDWIAVNTAARKAVPNPFATAIIPEVVEKWVDPNLSYKKAEQAKAKRMSYRSNAEFMSERYHTDVPYLTELNPGKSIWSLKPRDTIIVPNVKAFQIENLTGAAFKEDEALSQRHAVVDTKLNQVRIYEANPRALVVADPDSDTPARVANQSLIAAFPITPGKPQFIRYGKWEMKNAVELPVWRYDQQLLDTGKRSNNSLNIPGGPNNPVGVLWCGLSKPGIGMHGTSDPETIGRSQSSGCIRLANWDIVRIPQLLRPGCSVEIR
ncbi:MAG: L,D-transpeptidase [Akkermansiaceae bacterium]|nr:L,D-transpeptidase [Akkermansiaceae bacterium]MDP4646359.1 L,D-transpeptidase [Akkermansiaceae bacterium]MDP4721950.1 L,D-transpeptidase [Akkermansiaceae bacterium]MDP4779962.1 L,D-transpeptidase [Akkermansiaceae bacterium]MDP4847112.1 L,D-transpeptidase [Akkermansiaceae bacterium]